jgi:hypothetical protein
MYVNYLSIFSPAIYKCRRKGGERGGGKRMRNE